MRFAAGPAFHHPLVTFPFQKIAHVHARSRRAAAFRLKMDRRRSFVVPVDDIGDADVHRKQIRPFGKIDQNALAYRIGVLDIALAAGQTQ